MRLAVNNGMCSGPASYRPIDCYKSATAVMFRVGVGRRERERAGWSGGLAALMDSNLPFVTQGAVQLLRNAFFGQF